MNRSRNILYIDFKFRRINPHSLRDAPRHVDLFNFRNDYLIAPASALTQLFAMLDTCSGLIVLQQQLPNLDAALTFGTYFQHQQRTRICCHCSHRFVLRFSSSLSHVDVVAATLCFVCVVDVDFDRLCRKSLKLRSPRRSQAV